MHDTIVFFHIKDAVTHPLTKIGYTSLNSDGGVVVYCTDDGPLDAQYRAAWVEWRKANEAKAKTKA